MLRYIIRLDDATPTMNCARWEIVEGLLDRYGIEPIVGVIPENGDELFSWEEDPSFWSGTVRRWREKGWTIAQHGCHHVYHDCGDGRHSEFIGLDYGAQKLLIDEGYRALLSHDCRPACFFAPGHTFDEITVDVCRDSGYFDFISDGYAIYPFVERDMLFFPSVFDTPHSVLPFGVYTFVIHPNFVTDGELAHIEKFLKAHRKNFTPVGQILKEIRPDRKKNILDKAVGPCMDFARGVRDKLR